MQQTNEAWLAKGGQSLEHLFSCPLRGKWVLQPWAGQYAWPRGRQRMLWLGGPTRLHRTAIGASPLSPDLSCMACNREGWRGDIWRGLFVNGHYVLRPKDRPDLLHIFLYFHLPCLLLLSEALTFAVLFKSFTFKFSVKVRNFLCTREHFTVRVLQVIIYFIRRYVWLHMWLTIVVTESFLNLMNI